MHTVRNMTIKCMIRHLNSNFTQRFNPCQYTDINIFYEYSLWAVNAFSLLISKLSEEPSLCTKMNSSFSGTSCLTVTRASPCDSIPWLIECWPIGDVSPRDGDKMHVPLRYQLCLSHTHSHCVYQSRASLAQQSPWVKREAQGGLWEKRFPISPCMDSGKHAVRQSSI